MKTFPNPSRPRSLSASVAVISGAVFLAMACRQKLAADPDASPFSDYFAHWTDRVDAAQASQPKWITPLATTTPRLEQEFRYDQNRQTLNNGSTVDIYGGGKGLELIPTEQTEVIIAIPPYQVRKGIEPASGFNDWPGILVKYRLLSANERSGNYVVTLFAQYGLPTGALAFTNKNHVFTPTIAVGKGFGDFDVQATLGESIPTHDNSKSGKAILTNITAQYHVAGLFWPELELNRTDWTGGSRDDRAQTYLTPGLVVGRFLLGGRSKLIVGLGYQTAISQRYAKSPTTPAFNHNWILSMRTTF
jgi:hypothetical protein